MGIKMEELPADMSLSALAQRCKSEINKHRHGEPSDDRYCLEIFHRAISQRDHDAWNVLQENFSDLLMVWMHRHPYREAACRIDREENYVASAFARFWRATVNNPQLEFVSLAAALRFLYASLNGAIIDELRALRSKKLSLEIDGSDETGPFSRQRELAAPEPDDDSDVWQVIESMLPNERERRAAFLLLHCNLKPRDIVRYCAGEFDDVQEIYRLRRNILERLQRNRDRFRWLWGDDV